MEATGTDVDVEAPAANPADIDMNQINTMTLEEFRNLLNAQLSVPQAGASSLNGNTSQSSDSPRSQSSSESLKDRSQATRASWSAVREKARSVCKSIETSVSRSSRTRSSNDSGYLSQNGDNTPKRTLPNSPHGRPKTPTCLTRPKTPTSKPSALSSDSRPKTPTMRPKTPTKNVQRPKTPTSYSSVTSPTSTDESGLFSPTESCPGQVERPSTPSMIPRPSFLQRPSTPVSQVVASDNSKPAGAQSGDRRVISRPTTPGTTRRQPQIPRSTTPTNQEKSYSSIFQSRRAVTPGPGTTQTKTNVQKRSVTPGLKEKRSVISRPSDVSRSTDWTLAKRSQSVADVRSSLSYDSREISLSDDEADSATSDERSRSKSRTLSSRERRQRTSSADSRTLIRQAATEDASCLMVSRTNTGAHCVTLTENGSTRYDSNKKAGKFSRSASTDSSDFNRSRQRARTPDPSQLQQGMMRRKSEISIRPGSGKSAESRTEAWVNSTVNDTKRKLPPRPKRAVTPNSMHRKELELSSRSFEEIKEALRVPLTNGVRVNPEKLEAPPEDPKAYLQMERLFQKLREKELRDSVNSTVGGSTQDSSNNSTENVSQGILKNPDSRMASNKSLNSVRFSSSSSLSSSNSKSASNNSTPVRHAKAATSPLIHSRSLQSFSAESNGHILTSTPMNGLMSAEADEDSGDDETVGNTAEALVSKLKEMAKLRPRKEDNSGPKSRIPAPRLNKNRKSKSFSNLSTGSFDRPDGIRRQSSTTSNEDVPVFYNPEDELADLSFIPQDRDDVGDRSETPVPRMATPLTTGRSTFLNTQKDKTPRLVRAVSQDRSPSNSMSSLSSLSLSTADNEPEYL